MIGLLNLAIVVSAVLILQSAEVPDASVKSLQTNGEANDPMDVSVHIPRRTTVGTRKAGLICVPESRFKIEEFVSSDAYLEAVITAAFHSKGVENSQNQIEAITLMNLKVNLCARDYLFDKNRYSGSASFTFLVKFSNGDEVVETTNLKIDKQQAQSEADILQEAAAELVRIVTAKPQ